MTAPRAQGYEPRHPTLLATGLFTLWPALLSLPMLTGQWLASVWSDQYTAGFPFQAWSAEWYKRTGHLPLWNPEIFGGLPFVASGSGDIFYPTWLLRLFLPTTTAGNICFFVHYPLAGLFMYLLLRRLDISWPGAVVGGLAYELTGLIASYPSPGHDGKLFASTMLPLLCLGLLLAIRERRWTGYPIITAAVALSVFGHFQLTYYLLIASALFALYLAFGEEDRRPVATRIGVLALALASVALGFGIAAIQLMPFFAYIPFSPRASGYTGGYAGSVSFAIPWDHVPEFVLKDFVGSRDGYWGSNPLKLHSEYLGLPVVALAALGAGSPARRRLVLWVGAIGALFLLVSLGGDTPFYQLWWTLMPLVKKTRAPGMAFFIVAFATALFAALGTERALGPEGKGARRPLLITAGVVAALALAGVFGQLAHALASGIQASGGGRGNIAAADAASSLIMTGALTSAVALGAVAACFGLAGGRLTPQAGALAVALVVGGDLWVNARPFWSYVAPYGRDSVTTRMGSAPPPFRVLNLNSYPGSALMAFDVPELLGYHGNELHTYDELLGGKGEWRNLGRLQLWDLLAVRYAIVPVGMQGVDSIPGFRRVLEADAAAGPRVRLFERVAPAPYARVVPAALKADTSQILPTLLDPRLNYSSVVLFSPDQPVSPARVTVMPPPSPSQAAVAAWAPGAMTVTLTPPPPADSYLLIAENWFPDWHAWANGRQVPVLRGDYSLLTVPVAAGTATVQLTFRSRAYEQGKLVTHLALALLAVLAVASFAAERRRRA